jgi:hypothetical protein
LTLTARPTSIEPCRNKLGHWLCLPRKGEWIKALKEPEGRFNLNNNNIFIGEKKRPPRVFRNLFKGNRKWQAPYYYSLFWLHYIKILSLSFALSSSPVISYIVQFQSNDSQLECASFGGNDDVHL